MAGVRVFTDLKMWQRARAWSKAIFEQTEQERFKVGLSTTIFVLQFQRDLAIARGNELRAIVDYNKSLSNLTRNKAITLERYNMVLQ